MNYRSAVVFLCSVLVAGFVFTKNVNACVCTSRDDTVLGKFEEARFVVVVRAVSVEGVPEEKITYSGSEEIKKTEMVIKSTKMVVEKVYKGTLRVGDELSFGQGESGSCFETFDEDEVGAKFLFYLNPKEKSPKVWYAENCGQSKPLPGFKTGKVEDAADDLAYLEKMDKVRGQTRISGTLISYQWSPAHGGADFTRLAGRKVHITGDKGAYEAETDEDGVYEIYGLPPGRYTVKPEVRKGWELDNLSAWGGGGSGRREDDESSEVSLREGRHAYFDFFFKVNNRLRGRVLDTSGRPLKRVCVDLLPTQGKVSEYFKKTDCTNEGGDFEIDEIPFGGYVLVVNKDDRISPDEPFRRFYYPGAVEREKATVVNVVEGDELEAIDVRVPEMKEVVTIEGVFLSSDGRPVVRAVVVFRAGNTDETIESNALTRTDEDGRFSLNVLKGLSGKLSGNAMLDESDFKDCPQVVALLREKGNVNRRDVQTDAVEIQPRNSVDQVELKLPFPSCKGAKIFSQIRID